MNRFNYRWNMADSYPAPGINKNNKKVMPTIIASNNNILFDEPRKMNREEYILASSFPGDYDFLDIPVRYLVGMSVPPVMMANVAFEVYEQLLKDI